MQIDPNQVKWDAPAPSQSPATAIDPASVQWDAPAQQPAATSSSASAPGVGQQLARQVGLTARYGLEGLGQAAEVVTEPLRKVITDPVMRAIGAPEGKPLGQTMSGIADSLSLPQPATDTERVVGDATRFMAGGAGMAGAAGRVAQATAPGALQKVASAMAANPALQATSAAGAGAGSGVAREAGGNEWMQLGAGLAGGFSVGGLVQAARSGLQSAVNKLLPVRAQRMEQQIEQGLGQAGVNWGEVPDSIRQGMRSEVEKALRSGQSLDSGALSRLLEFKQVGATPTRGTLTLDPVQITREQNLARMGANSTDSGLHGLAKVQNENNRALVESLNRLGAGQIDDAFATSERVMGSLQRGIDAEKTGVNALYSQARDSAGRSFPLDGHTFTTQASKLLDDNLLGHALPASVQKHLNEIAMGRVPFTVDYAEQFKTAMGNLQRASNDGQTRMALGMVRQALDEAPVLELGRAGSATGARATGSTSPYAGGTEMGEQALDAFNRARVANRSMMERIERIPGLKAVYDGQASPDDFMQKFVISRTAKAADTFRLAQELRRSDPQTFEAVRGSIAAHLKANAIGSAADETGKFSASSYNRALLALGRTKLAQFFTEDEIAQLKAVGKVAQYTTVQPVGSAVNNSNSGALVMGKGLDLLDSLASKLPLLGLGPTVSGVTRNAQQRQALNISRALASSGNRNGSQRPGMTFGSLMAMEEQE